MHSKGFTTVQINPNKIHKRSNWFQIGSNSIWVRFRKVPKSYDLTWTSNKIDKSLKWVVIGSTFVPFLWIVSNITAMWQNSNNVAVFLHKNIHTHNTQPKVKNPASTISYTLKLPEKYIIHRRRFTDNLKVHYDTMLKLDLIKHELLTPKQRGPVCYKKS